MSILKSFVIAFSVYSKIPVPQFEWKEEDMKYMMCFFPWVGGLIGLLLYGWAVLCRKLDIGSFCQVLMCAVIPLAVSGGFHVDGFMDTMDAFHSYQEKERKLEILKDSHIGAFAVIMLALYGLIYLAAYSEVQDIDIYRILCAGFFLSRALSGVAVLMFPKAKKNGMLHTFDEVSRTGIVRNILVLQCIACVIFMVIQSVTTGSLIAGTAFVVFWYYYRKTKKELGGITGDTAGYFVTVCEGAMAVMAACICILK